MSTGKFPSPNALSRDMIGTTLANDSRISFRWMINGVESCPLGTKQDQWSMSIPDLVLYDFTAPTGKNQLSVTFYCEFDSTTNLAPGPGGFDRDESPETELNQYLRIEAGEASGSNIKEWISNSPLYPYPTPLTFSHVNTWLTKWGTSLNGKTLFVAGGQGANSGGDADTNYTISSTSDTTGFTLGTAFAAGTHKHITGLVNLNSWMKFGGTYTIQASITAPDTLNLTGIPADWPNMSPHPFVGELLRITSVGSNNNGYFSILTCVNNADTTATITIDPTKHDGSFRKNQTNVSGLISLDQSYKLNQPSPSDALIGIEGYPDLQTLLQRECDKGNILADVRIHPWISNDSEETLHRFYIIPYWLLRSRLLNHEIVPIWAFTFKAYIREVDKLSSYFEGIWDTVA